MGKKHKLKKTVHFLIIATVFNETSFASIHVGSDYFPLQLLSISL